MGPSIGSKQYDPLEELESLEPTRMNKSAGPQTNSEVKRQQQDKQSGKKQTNGSSGGSWFGGFLSKLAPKPKNQMILPDDSNPSVSL